MTRPLLSTSAAVFALLIAGCGPIDQSEAAVRGPSDDGLTIIDTETPPDFSSPMRYPEVRYGHPEGEPPVPPVPHAYSRAELALRTSQMNAASRASAAVFTAAHEADDWLGAADAVESLVADLPAEMSDAPDYLLDQNAVLALMLRPDAPTAPATDAEATVLRRLLDRLVATRSGNVDVAADLLDLLGDRLPADERRAAAGTLLMADQRYTENHAEMTALVEASCDDCRDAPFVADLRARDNGLDAARARLARAAK